MKLLVTGASGLLGHKVAQLALERGNRVYSVHKEHPVSLGEPVKLDLTEYDRISKVASELKPDLIIHAAAYTDVDGCEVNRGLALKVNAEATKHLAKASTEVGAHLTYISTDYVFDGEEGLYREDDEPNPINYYGYTKLLGETYVKEHASRWCIVRPSAIYGWGPSHKLNFAMWLMSNLQDCKEVKVLTDQYVSPTLNNNLAEMLVEIAEKEFIGVLHASGPSRVSRYEFAVKLVEVFSLEARLIRPAKMTEMSWKARRPRDSSLNVDKALNLLKCKPLPVDEALNLFKRERKRVQR